jgi:alanyl-tRNA synthetase
VIGVIETGAGVEVFLDRTPFYAEAGGQVGDTGVLETADTAVRVTDTQYALPGLIAHRIDGGADSVAVGAEVTARVDAERRDRTRRNHTATHLLHWALREVLGAHVKQAGSVVAPDRLRFDFHHMEAVSPEQLRQVEDLANAQVLTDAAVRVSEVKKADADARGAIGLFGEKYGDVVRVVEAGDASIELCGGTHVQALGQIGPIKILGEGSIGANVRRIEALTGEAALERFRADEATLKEVADALKATPTEVPGRVEKLLAQIKSLQEELEAARARDAAGEAVALAAAATDGVVAVRRDGGGVDDLRRLALAVRDGGADVAILVGVTPDGRAGIAAAVSKARQQDGVSAGAIVADAAKLLGGGAPRTPDVSAGGGKNVDAVDDALATARAAAVDAVAGTG